MVFLKKVIRALVGPPLYVLLSGLVLFGVAVGFTCQYYTIKQNGLIAQGQVVQLNERCDDDGCTYGPVVDFRAKDGQNITYTSSHYTNPPAHNVGETVMLFYLPEEPHKAAIQGEGRFFRLAFTAAGGGAVIAGLVMFARALRERLMAGE